MSNHLTMSEMLKAGVHFGHQTRFWNPKMAPYIFGVHDKIHIINLEHTLPMFTMAKDVAANIAAKRGKILFLGTKPAAQKIIEEEAKRCNMPFVSHRWLGGMLTNFKTIRKSIKRLRDLEFLIASPKMKTFTKKEALMLMREKDKLEYALGGIKEMGGLPEALFVIDVKHEKIAIAEANRLRIPVIAVVDSNCDPDGVDYIIPGNDDSVRAIRLYASQIASAIMQAKKEANIEDSSSQAEVKKAAGSIKRKVVAKKKDEKIEPKKAESKAAAAKKTEAAEKKTSAVKKGSAPITAALVKELRERTQAGMLECKKALEATGGDINLAVEEMRKSGAAKADKKAGNIAAEGVVTILKNRTSTAAVILEVNSQTDFVARDENFKNFVEQVASRALKEKVGDLNQLLALPMEADREGTIEEARKALVAKLGENIQIRRIAFMQSKQKLGAYQHGDRIGVLVELSKTDDDLSKDLAMHIAASQPQAIKEKDVPQELIEKEKEIFTAQSKDSGKSPDIIEKMIDGRIKKFLAEITLEGQAFVKDPNVSVGKLLKSKEAEVLTFHRFEVGEGIEKKEEDFAAEVMAQVKGI